MREVYLVENEWLRSVLDFFGSLDAGMDVIEEREREQKGVGGISRSLLLFSQFMGSRCLGVYFLRCWLII